MTKVLIITKNFKQFRRLSYYLSYSGFIVTTSPNAEHSLTLINAINFQIILIDQLDERGTLYRFCQEVRNYGCRASLILLTENYREFYLEAGVDDYILKPFGLNEFRTILQKQIEKKTWENRALTLGDLRIDVNSSLVYVQEKIVTLGKKELEVLMILTKKAGSIVRLNPLMTAERMYALKKKHKKVAGERLEIKFIKGLGYKLIAQGT